MQSSSGLSDSSAIAEGGRYDDIVAQYRMQVQTSSSSHTNTQRVAVGVRFNVGRMATAAALAQYQHSIATDVTHR
jgi:histidyl-tRNA synthetase